jgi:hypothetical protein
MALIEIDGLPNLKMVDYSMPYKKYQNHKINHILARNGAIPCPFQFFQKKYLG